MALETPGFSRGGKRHSFRKLPVSNPRKGGGLCITAGVLKPSRRSLSGVDGHVLLANVMRRFLVSSTALDSQAV